MLHAVGCVLFLLGLACFLAGLALECRRRRGQIVPLTGWEVPTEAELFAGMDPPARSKAEGRRRIVRRAMAAHDAAAANVVRLWNGQDPVPVSDFGRRCALFVAYRSPEWLWSTAQWASASEELNRLVEGITEADQGEGET